MCQWYKNGWFHKITALTIATSYFILLIFINNTSYVWATLALVFVLFVTTFTCSSTKSPLLLQLRGTRAGAYTGRNLTQDENSEGQENQEVSTNTAQQQMTIWVTDVPPSYAFVMSDMPPPTPPPSYGSAILMFPPPYVDPNKTEEVQQENNSLPGSRRRFRPLSISTQVSVTSVASECPTPQISFSTQISVVNASSDPFSDTVSLRTHLFLSRQVSREDLPETDCDSIDSNASALEVLSCDIPVIVVNRIPELAEDSGSQS